jgi:hypothetical protein
VIGPAPDTYRQIGGDDGPFLAFATVDHPGGVPVPAAAVMSEPRLSHYRRPTMLGATHAYCTNIGVLRAACVRGNRIHFMCGSRELDSDVIARLFPFRPMAVNQRATGYQWKKFQYRQSALSESRALAASATPDSPPAKDAEAVSAAV